MTRQAEAVARLARREDAEAIARIYNQGIEDRVATFETDPRSTADIERLLDDRLGRYPAIIVECDGQVVAWAGAGSYRARPCYDPIAEHSVYVERGHRGSGIGRVALEALCAEAERLGFLQASEPHLSRERGQPGVASQGRLPRRGRLPSPWQARRRVARLRHRREAPGRSRQR
jgi:GNAT superfamily N-acetyltransferase